MSWNYRLFRKVHLSGDGTPETEFFIGEAYYTKDNTTVIGWSDAVAPVGETVEEVREELQHMLLALDLPPLDADAEPSLDKPSIADRRT